MMEEQVQFKLIDYVAVYVGVQIIHFFMTITIALVTNGYWIFGIMVGYITYLMFRLWDVYCIYRWFQEYGDNE